jgi:alkaline phosphatase D
VAAGLGALSAADSADAQSKGTAFVHGVASGDPLPDRVIIWTRLTPSAEATPGSGLGPDSLVRWEMSHNRFFSTVVAAGEVTTRAASDHTIKVDVTGLAPATSYFYRFEFNGAFSPIGQTRTAPASSRGDHKPAFRGRLMLEFRGRLLLRLSPSRAPDGPRFHPASRGLHLRI